MIWSSEVFTCRSYLFLGKSDLWSIALWIVRKQGRQHYEDAYAILAMRSWEKNPNWHCRKFSQEVGDFQTMDPWGGQGMLTPAFFCVASQISVHTGTRVWSHKVTSGRKFPSRVRAGDPPRFYQNTVMFHQIFSLTMPKRNQVMCCGKLDRAEHRTWINDQLKGN